METIADFPQGRPVASAVAAMHQRIGASTVSLDPALSQLLNAACNLAGLELLLLIARDPLTADTAEGFASRLCHPVREIRVALESLNACGILESCTPPGQSAARATYWLACNPHTMATLRRLNSAYLAGPSNRCGLLCSLPMAM